jgi:para-aminobenzoate synthetase
MHAGEETSHMRTLLVDNHDSYTFNLFQLISVVNGTDPVVFANDDPALAEVSVAEFDNIVISPGPGRPQEARDLGHVGDLLARATVPVLGVCLGHQALGHVAGAEVVTAPQPRHGHLTTVEHYGDELFAGVPRTFTAVRYHSLCVQEPLPERLLVTARAEDGVVMALRYRDLPRWGVQFHPESIASEYGYDVMVNFRDLTEKASERGAVLIGRGPAPARREFARVKRGLEVVELPFAVDAEAAFVDLYADSPDSFWLDSSRVERGLSRFSFLGDASGPLSEVLSYCAAARAVEIRDAGGLRVRDGNVMDLLEERLRERRVANPGLPFDFNAGYVGYFGYEMKADCGADAPHRAETPDAAWIFADRLVAVDHEEDRTYVVAFHLGDEATRAGARTWAEASAARLRRLTAPAEPERGGAGPVSARWIEEHLVRDAAGYEQDVEECLDQLRRGESYEICLTTKLRAPFHEDDVAFYRRLRRANPAPYSALLRVDGVTVFCSSPERFLRIDEQRRVESKPIKGTAPRDTDPECDARIARDLQRDPKTRAENLMIVDLLRNDLGRICEIGSVQVERYMAVESYATVHQLVSTIAGRLNPAVSAVGAVRSCFPGGSMTGAPKLRTMEIIDRLEGEARGVYSGTLGYFGLAGGADLNIVIRTAVRVGDELTVGAGGAVVLGSSPRGEYEEMVLKAGAPLRSLRAGRGAQNGAEVHGADTRVDAR